MRIIAGSARGRRIEAPEGRNTRPTLDRVRENLFNILQMSIRDSRVLDLFAGSGALSIEALSRGAAEAVFVDEDRESVRIVKENLRTCGMSAPVFQTDALDFLRSCGQFDLIFVDPPYDAGLYEPVLKSVNAIDILSDGGIIACEARRETELPEMTAPYVRRKEYRYGKVKICIYAKETEA